MWIWDSDEEFKKEIVKEEKLLKWICMDLETHIAAMGPKAIHKMLKKVLIINSY
jgi:hypothetical protein